MVDGQEELDERVKVIWARRMTFAKAFCRSPNRSKWCQSLSANNVTRKKCLAAWIDRKSYALVLFYKKKSARELAIM